MNMSDLSSEFDVNYRDHFEAIENIKTILEINDDAIVTLYLSRAIRFVKGYCNVTEVPVDLYDLLEDLAVYFYRRKGVENIKSEGKGSLSESYRDGLPDDYIQSLNQHRRMKFV
jgi:Phage gp6-like head-tail connector protein